jgi:hypothetical protein
VVQNRWAEFWWFLLFFFDVNKAFTHAPPYADINFAGGSVCCAQVNADPSSCHRGCFLLSHDDPVATRTNYNTSADFVALLADPALNTYFTDASVAERVHVALCFKYTGVAQCEDKEWLSLADGLFAAANVTLQRYNLAVELILDGASTPTTRPCLINRWLPWNATWVIGA